MFYFEKPRIREVFEYSRQSLDEKDVRQTHSLPLQKEFNREFADRMGLKIIDRFVDDASAKIPNNRPAFTAMLKELGHKDSNKKRAEGVLCWHPDRLSRNALEAGQLVQMICDEKIKDLFFPTYHFHNDPSGIEHLMMEFGRAISYSGWLSINSKRGSTGRERKGAWVYGRSKFGYTKLRECPQHPKRCSLYPIPNPKTFPARKRLVELWVAGVVDEECSRTIKREFGLTIKRSSISDMRRDPFNYGIYVIKPGCEDERRIDFRKLKAPDGTSFKPVTNEQVYWSFQSFIRKKSPTRVKTKHINPLQGVVRCRSCKVSMRPARRKIHRRGGEKTLQLGYECQTSGCSQSRIKAGVLFDQIAAEIENKFGILEKSHYHQYLIGLRSFLSAKTKSTKVQRTRLSKRLNSLETEKAKVIERRLGAINSYEYDLETKNWCQKRLNDLDKSISDIKSELTKLGQDTNATVRTFKQIIELKENLHRYWLQADDSQKKAIAEKLLLNLDINKVNIRSVTWQKPVSDWPKTPNFQSGGGNRQLLESYFDCLWCSLLPPRPERQLNHLQKLAELMRKSNKAIDQSSYFAATNVGL